jgi:hypothetical protein
MEQLNTKRDQRREKFRIKTAFVLSTKRRAKAPTRGSANKADNIFFKSLKKSQNQTRK